MDQAETAAMPTVGPDRDELAEWLAEISDALARGELDRHELLALLEHARHAQREATSRISALTDTLLLLAHDEAGASLPDLAEVYNRRGGRRYVQGPRSRLATVRQHYPTATDLLTALRKPGA